jgi:hypothetical protein
MLCQLSYSRKLFIDLLIYRFIDLNHSIIKSPNHQITRGESRIRTYEGISQQIYSLPQLAALVSPLYK